MGAAAAAKHPETRSLAVDCGDGLQHLYFQQHTASEASGCAVFLSGLPFSEGPLAGWLVQLLEPFGAAQQVVLHPSQVCLGRQVLQLQCCGCACTANFQSRTGISSPCL